MKKTIAITLAFCLTLLFAACGGKPEGQGAADQSAAADTQAGPASATQAQAQAEPTSAAQADSGDHVMISDAAVGSLTTLDNAYSAIGKDITGSFFYNARDIDGVTVTDNEEDLILTIVAPSQYRCLGLDLQPTTVEIDADELTKQIESIDFRYVDGDAAARTGVVTAVIDWAKAKANVQTLEENDAEGDYAYLIDGGIKVEIDTDSATGILEVSIEKN